ncbi:hypothetical protein EYF80_067861 [Liparis tanakae]|uniref:Uncharacterized protein n=1 Tax=Liparis tanakae TaxID=230148 RepID=A0A4Z2DZS1_9TELE|nr:hypothetical protein EYF80_067861 [Liparis tanakae]
MCLLFLPSVSSSSPASPLPPQRLLFLSSVSSSSPAPAEWRSVSTPGPPMKTVSLIHRSTWEVLRPTWGNT